MTTHAEQRFLRNDTIRDKSEGDCQYFRYIGNFSTVMTPVDLLREASVEYSCEREQCGYMIRAASERQILNNKNLICYLQPHTSTPPQCLAARNEPL